MNNRRTVGVVTVGRSDYGIFLPILRRIQEENSLRLHLIVAGMHWLDRFGHTVDEIQRDGFPIKSRIEFPLDDDTPQGISQAMGTALLKFSASYAEERPDILLVLGDRFETHAAASATLPFKIPIAHIHGGELTLGVIDNVLRHSITHMAHLHFVACEEYGRRIAQLGEERWRITVSGAPALDHLKNLKFLSREELSEQLGFRLEKPPILVTYHPVTLEFEQTEWQVSQLLQSLESFDLPILFTAPNADTSNQTICKMIDSFVQKHPRAHFVANLGWRNYFNVMAMSAVMVGNSSSGLIEAPSLELPVVNIGNRQAGRVRGKNVIDVGYEQDKISLAVQRSLTTEFREGLRKTPNPYGEGKAAERIVKVLKEINLDEKLIRKKFIDQPVLQ